MRRYSDNYQLGVLSELNVTPLLDLAFVLLVIFMIAAPFLGGSTEILLPSSRGASEAVDPRSIHRLSATLDGQIALDFQPLSGASEITPALRSLLLEDPGAAVLIEADRALSLQRLVELLDRVKQAGIAHVGILTAPAEASPSPPTLR